MTIEEVEELRKQELNNKLRFPNLQIERRQVNDAFVMQKLLYSIVNDKVFISKMINKLRLKKMGFEIAGQGTDENPYVFKSCLWEGKCFNIKYIFKNKKCPFKKGYCFSNAVNMVAEMHKLENINDCNCVSGIALIQEGDNWKKILHSVVELNDKWVVDVNIGMVISKDLYCKLFMFEELVRFSGQDIEKMFKIFKSAKAKEIVHRFDLKTYHLAFAMDDLMDLITNETKKQKDEEFGL